MQKPQLALLSAIALALVALSQSRAQDDSLYWYEKYPDALREAKRTGKPIFLEFRCEP